MYHRTKKFITTLFYYLAFSSALYALPSDKEQILHIYAKSYFGNFKTGVNVYEGDVVVDQGTTHLRADRLITRNNKENKIQEITAYGLHSPAHYWTLSKIGEPEIHAWAKIIIYYPIESNATLEQNVEVKQGLNSFKGELIHYNSNDETITVPASNNARAVLVYNPTKSITHDIKSSTSQ